MRVLVIPEVYRPRDPTACGTVRDAVAWVGEWLARDSTLHVYWLLPPRGSAGYERSDVLAHRDRVTLIEAETLGCGDGRGALTDVGYTPAQLDALRNRIFEPGAYLDVVVDQLRGGRFALHEWLLERVDQWASSVRPFDVVANVHDLQVPFKYRYCSHRDRFQMYEELSGAAFADGRWFTAGVDRREFREHAGDFLRPGVVDRAAEDAVTIGSPVDVDAFEGAYADEPGTFHVAGSLWSKKHVGRLLDVGEFLHDRFGVETVLTSMEGVPREYRDPDWVTAHPNADRETYERALREGDLAACASEYETMPRTPFEQAASGQVLLLPDEPWTKECVPEDYGLVADRDDFEALAAWAFEHWDEAVSANRRLVSHLSRTRSPAAVGGRTHADLVGRVEAKRRRYEADPGRELEVASSVLETVDGKVSLVDLVERTAEHTDDGRPLTEHADCARADLVYALRSLGYVDTGSPDTPVFESSTSPG